MIKIFGENYYLDLNQISDFIQVEDDKSSGILKLFQL